MSGASLAEATTAPPADRPAPGAMTAQLARTGRVALVGLVLFVLAAAARLVAIDAYVTIDESRWVQRASDFWALIEQQNVEDTFIIGHPGVTTMRTALLGLGAARARQFSFLEGRTDATRRDGYFEALVAARRPFALVGALGVVAIGLLGWRLFGAGPGMLGGLLLACEPFLVAHARVVHLDSSLTSYAAVAALSGIVYWSARGAWPYLLLSGAATGLAFLTKAPSVYVILFVPLVAGLSWLAGDRVGRGSRLLARRPAADEGPRSERSPRILQLVRIAVELAVWGLIAAGVGWLLWPVLRIDPIGTVLKMAQFTERVGGGEHDNFFAGQVTDDPGLLFYPLALLLRLSPVTLVGAILVAALWRRLTGAQRGRVLLLALYCLGFMAMMTIGPKKFDRYLLPLFPMVGLLAGLGLWQAGQWLAASWPGRSVTTSQNGLADTRWLVVPVLALTVQAGIFLLVFKYPLAYYSPLLGGGAAADRLVLVGWGEGLDQAGAWIDAQPRPLGEPTVATSYHRVLQAQLSGSAVPLEHARMADYVVPYINTLQRGAEADVLTPYLTGGAPEHSVQINGIEYARVYRGPHYPTGADLEIEIGGRVTLLRYDAAPGSGALRPGEEVTVLLRWDRPTNGQERALVAILGSDGRVVVQDERALGEDGPDAQGQPGDLHRLTLPKQTAPGTYELAIRVLDGRSRAAVPASSGPRTGDDLVILREIVVEHAP